MFHVGKIMEVINPKAKGTVSADKSVQAVVRMWDSNLLILGVDSKLSRKIKERDFVLCDYMPMTPESKHRNLKITKILPKKQGDKIWREFEGEVERRRKMIREMKGTPYTPHIR
ncbi:hypothetical protein GF318_02035 [Candidatus Micrarchaeota archaeon]|nr:hypothetical protein [Candidatus Micrarchaeota archaeon]